ncbi:MAG: PAS domain-containing protein [Planctomycetes bacterium]|nr:PAS domain-containing protein [Planctomycetota bacterium]
MPRSSIVPTGRVITFGEDELIVSKTDCKGVITYANRVFQRVSGYSERELVGAPHSIIRHPAMPRCVFKLLWDTIGKGEEIFAYVLNLARSGDEYWVFAHVTPSWDAAGKLVGYHSSRRAADRDAIEKVKPIYATLLEIERRHSDPQAAMQASTAALLELLGKAGVEYLEFVFSITSDSSLESSTR